MKVEGEGSRTEPKNEWMEMSERIERDSREKKMVLTNQFDRGERRSSRRSDCKVW